MKLKVNPNTIHFKTFGCKVNQYETQVLRELFLKAGFCENGRRNSDIYILNTCSLTKNADHKVKRYITEIKRENPKARLLAVGCGAFNPESGLERLNGIEIFKGSDKRKLLEMVAGAKSHCVDCINSFHGHERAFVKVQDGCDNFCSYCVIPYLRGKPVSRPSAEILTEVKTLVNNNFKEIVICGINLGIYGLDRSESLLGLLKKVLALKDNFRLRLSSIEPNYISGELIEFMAGERRLCPHFHLPLQSGDDKILKLMNRKYSTREYFCLLDKIRRKVRDVSVTTDILVGFPQETEENFKNTLLALEKGDFLKTHVFSYSRREQTASAKLKGHVFREVIIRRRKKAQLKAQKVSYSFRRTFINKVLPVLIERRKNKKTGERFGFCDNYIEVQLKADNCLVDSIRPAKIIDVKLHENLAELA